MQYTSISLIEGLDTTVVTINKDITEKMKARRIELDLTQEEMAAKLSIAQNTYSRWESGEKTISAEDLPRIAKAQFVQVSYYLDDEARPSAPEGEVTYQPILDEVQVAAYRGNLTPGAVEDIKDYIRFRAQQEAKKRGAE